MTGNGKAALRAELAARRRAIDPPARTALSERIQRRVMALKAWQEARTIALYAPLPSEVQTGLLWREAHARGAVVCFPAVVSGSRMLELRRAEGPQVLRPGTAGILEAEGEPVPLEAIGLFVVPGLGFTRDGARLGRGGGHFDTTLAGAPDAFRVGMAFGVQVLERLPVEGHDVRMHAVATEDALFES